MKAGDIVRVPGYSRDWVALPVTRLDIRRGVNARSPGMYLLGGAWYGKNLMDGRTYGKLIPAKGPHKIVGHVKSRRTLSLELRAARFIKRPSSAIERIRDLAELREYRQ